MVNCYSVKCLEDLIRKGSMAWDCDTNNNNVSTEKKSKSGLQKYRDSYKKAFRCVGPS